MSGKGSFRAPPPEELQQHFTQYSIDAFVAVGGMGAVYRATQISVDRPVALKILPAEMASDESFRKRFALEAKAMAKLSHRNLVQLYDFGETSGIFWMTQEWVDGRTIFEVMHEEKRLSPSEAAALVAQACEGLGYAHKQGIVHRDVKPANMMVDKDGILKLTDFGLAGIHGGEGGLRTKEGKRFATEEYAAPEIWDAKAVIDHRVDIFALGVLLYEALTGKRPTGTFRMPSELRPGLDRRFDDIVVRAMQRMPEDRYASCAELLGALRAVVTSGPKVRLQTAARPAAGGLKVKPMPLTPPPAKHGSPARGVPVEMKDGTQAVSVSLATPTVEGPARNRKSIGPVIAVSLLLLLVLLVVGWVVLRAAGNDEDTDGDDPAVERGSGQAGPNGPAGSTSSNRGAGTARGLSTVQSREPAARPEEVRPPGPQGPPNSLAVRETQLEPGPEPSEGVERVLEALDEELRTSVTEPYSAYLDARADLEPKYLAECARQEEQAVQAGDLDGVLLWMAEAQAIEGGEFPTPAQIIPQEAVALRKQWRDRIDPLEAALASIQSAYVEKCAELEKAAETDAAREALRERREGVVVFRNFLALCSGRAPPFPPGSVGGSDPEEPGNEGVEIGGSLESLDARLKSGSLSRLPTGTVEYRGNYYLVVPGPLSWPDAKSWCEQRGGHLATLATREEQEWFGRIPGGQGVSVLLGAQRSGDRWIWITGERWEGGPPRTAGQSNDFGSDGSVLGWKDGGFADLTGDPIAFVIEWEGPSLVTSMPERIRGLLPGPMVTAYETTWKRLGELEKAGNTPGMAAAIKSYGRILVRDEKALTRQRKIGAARAVRAIKNEMLVLLKSLEAGPAPEPAPVQPVVDSSSLMIRNGNPTDGCSYEKKDWRRRGRSFQNQAQGAKLTSRLALGEGDFEVSLRLTTNTKVGGSGFYLSLGDLYLYFDSESGAVECWNGWIKDKSRTTGVQLGSIVKSGIPFECVVGRKGETISMLLNGKAAVSAKVHSSALGVVTIGAGEAVLGIEAFAMEGSLIEAPRQEILHVARSSVSNWYAGQTQLLKTSDEGLLALYLIWQGRATATVRLNRSRDGGKRWEEGVTLVDPKNSRQMPVWSFSAAANQRRDETWLAYAVGSANHRLYVKAGRNGGRNWTQPVEVTKDGKEAGANVSFAGQGLVVTNNPAKPGRIILPMVAGGQERQVWLLVSESGRDWKKIGPLMRGGAGLVEIVEDLDGRIWVATGAPGGERSHGNRLWVMSRDGGDTWSRPEQSSLPDAGTRGSLAVTEGPGRKPFWYYVTADGPVGQALPERNNLTLFGSKDAGKTWLPLRRFHFGNGDFPSVVPIRDGSVGITYKRQTWNNNGDQVRYVELSDVWGR